jgi:hypothetical protein
MEYFYLDVSPMIRALQQNPSEFEMRYNCVRHRPSRHWLGFDPNGNARLSAHCSCAEFPISSEQSAELRTAVANWQETYWRPLMVREAAERRVAEINREFARHFAPKTWWRRAVETALAWFGFRAPEPHFHIDPTLPEDADLHPGLPPVPACDQEEVISA